MRRPGLLPVALLLAALAGVAWLFLRGGGRQEDPVETPAIERVPSREAPEARAPAELQGAPPSAEQEPTTPKPASVLRPEDFPRGTLTVTAVAPDGTPYPPSEVRVFLEPATRSWWWSPTGVPDPEKKTWRFEKVPAGRVHLRVAGDHVVEATQDAVVEADQEQEATIHADRGGAIAYKVVLYSGEMPEQVTLAVLDIDRKPVRATWQVRMPGMLTSPRTDVKVTQAAQGVAYGLPPGTYHLRATSPNDESDDAEVAVVAGETVEAEIRLRK